MSRILVALVLILALLVGTNPSRTEFNAWAQSHVAKKIEEEARKRGEDPNDGSSQIGGAIVGFLISNMPIERIREGVKRLAASVVKEMERAGVLEEVPATP